MSESLITGVAATVVSTGLSIYNYIQLKSANTPEDIPDDVILTNIGVLGVGAFVLGSSLTMAIGMRVTLSAILMMISAGLNIGLSLTSLIGIIRSKPTILQDLRRTNLILGIIGGVGIVGLIGSAIMNRGGSPNGRLKQV